MMRPSIDKARCTVRVAVFSMLMAILLAGCGEPGTPLPTLRSHPSLTPIGSVETAPGLAALPSESPAISPTATFTARPTATASLSPAPSFTAAPTPYSPPTFTYTPTPPPTPTASLTAPPTATPTATPTDESRVLATVVEVHDGDTIVVEIDGARYEVRYIGVDAPETGQEEIGFAELAAEAAEANRALVEGQVVRLERDASDVDAYGRLLRYVWVGETLVNAELVRQGFAQARAYPPDVRYQALFEQLQAEARATGLGIWAPRPASTPAAPEAKGEGDCPYIGNSNTGKFHYASCDSVAKMLPKHRVCLGSREEAVAQGFVPCKRCNP